MQNQGTSSFPQWLHAFWHPPHDRSRWYTVRIDGGARFEAYLTGGGVWRSSDNVELSKHNLEYVARIQA